MQMFCVEIQLFLNFYSHNSHFSLRPLQLCFISRSDIIDAGSRFQKEQLDYSKPGTGIAFD